MNPGAVGIFLQKVKKSEKNSAPFQPRKSPKKPEKEGSISGAIAILAKKVAKIPPRSSLAFSEKGRKSPKKAPKPPKRAPKKTKMSVTATFHVSDFSKSRQNRQKGLQEPSPGPNLQICTFSKNVLALGGGLRNLRFFRKKTPYCLGVTLSVLGLGSVSGPCLPCAQPVKNALTPYKVVYRGPSGSSRVLRKSLGQLKTPWPSRSGVFTPFSTPPRPAKTAKKPPKVAKLGRNRAFPGRVRDLPEPAKTGRNQPKSAQNRLFSSFFDQIQ